MRWTFFLLAMLFGGWLAPAAAQNYFRGELDYRNTFIDKETFLRLFEDVSETITIKGGKSKLSLLQPIPGQVIWQIDDFENGKSYECKQYMPPKEPVQPDTVVSVITLAVANKDSSALTSNDSILATITDTATLKAKDTSYVMTNDTAAIKITDTSIVKTKDTTPVLKIYEIKLCRNSTKLPPPSKKTFSGMRMLDTMMMVAGINCHVMESIEKDFRVAEYYYSDSIKIDSVQYSCQRVDGDDKLYKFNGGCLILKRVIYDIDAYIYVQELQAIREKEIGDEVFVLPKDLELIPENK